MIIREEPQGSLNWMIARAGVVTASEFDNILTPEFKLRTGQTVITYLHRKAAEKWLGGPLAGFSVWDTEQGKLLEEEAIPAYALLKSTTVRRVGLITTDDGRVGCSPDGLIGENSGIEVKCPAPHTHVGYLLANTLPKDYAAQVHGSMYVTGYDNWQFMSFARKFPELILTVKRDKEIQESIHNALEAFLERLEAAFSRLVEINGEPPKQSTFRSASLDEIG